MLPFNKKKDEEKNNPQKKKNPGGRKKKEKIEPWGRKERFLVLLILGVTVFASALLGASAREWNVPGLPRITLPDFSFEKTISLDGPNREDGQKANAREVVNEYKQKTRDLSGVYGLYVYRLEGGEEYGLFETEIFGAASLIKLPVIISLYKEAEAGNIDLDEVYVIKEDDKIGGAGSLQYKSAGYEVTWRQMAMLMGKQSDNTAFGIVRERLGDRKIQETIFALGMTNTSLSENETTPHDIGILFENLWSSSHLAKENSDEILEYLTDTGFEERIPAGVPENIRVAHKIGSEVGIISDAGIVYGDKPFILVIMTKGVVESEATEILPKLSQIIYDYETSN